VTLLPCYDPNDPRNGSGYHTGKSCIVSGCEKPAGMWWSPLWCMEHNMERMRQIDGQFDRVRRALAGKEAGEP